MSLPVRGARCFVIPFLLALMAVIQVGAAGLDSRDPIAPLTRTSLLSLASGSVHRAAPASSYLTPRVIPLQTRVVSGDGTRASDNSIWVGTNQYVAPPLLSGPRDSAGFHLLVLERSSLAVVTNFSAANGDYGTTVLTEVLQALQDRADVLVLFWEMSPAGPDPFDNPLAVALAGFGANSKPLYKPSNNQFAAA